MSEKITDPSKNKFRYFRDISSEEIIETIKISSNRSEVLSKLNCKGNDKNFRKLTKFINDNNISISHFKKRFSREDYEKILNSVNIVEKRSLMNIE